MFQRYEKWKVEEKLGSKAHPCYIRIRVITNRVISRFKCTMSFWHQMPKGMLFTFYELEILHNTIYYMYCTV